MEDTTSTTGKHYMHTCVIIKANNINRPVKPCALANIRSLLGFCSRLLNFDSHINSYTHRFYAAYDHTDYLHIRFIKQCTVAVSLVAVRIAILSIIDYCFIYSLWFVFFFFIFFSHRFASHSFCYLPNFTLFSLFYDKKNTVNAFMRYVQLYFF